MSDTAGLRRQIDSAGDLQSVVRTMKAMAASSIGQYENAVRALDDYYRTVQLGLAACLRPGMAFDAAGDVAAGAAADVAAGAAAPGASQSKGAILALVFGSDQGLVGQFNYVMVEFTVAALDKLTGEKTVWAIGERIGSRLGETALVQEKSGKSGKSFMLPNSIGAVTQLVGQILTELEAVREQGEIGQVFLFHNRPEAGAIHAPVVQRLLPLDDAWRRDLAGMAWPTNMLPEVVNDKAQTLLAFVREYLFVSLFRACAESLASENASRLSAMQRAEKNIDDLLENLNRNYSRLRQGRIDEELFDVVSGFEALTGQGGAA